MGEIFKGVQQKVHKGWSTTKMLVAYMSLWGLVFSLVTIGRLRVAFDYDDTLVFSTPAYEKAFKSGVMPYSPQFWNIVNQSYDLERPKVLSNLLAWGLRLFGFRVTVLAARPPEGGEPLKKEWRRLVSQFVFVPDGKAKHTWLSKANYVLYFGDSDTDILQGRLARVTTLRVLRHPKSGYKDDYTPGAFREIIIPLSQY